MVVRIAKVLCGRCCGNPKGWTTHIMCGAETCEKWVGANQCCASTIPSASIYMVHICSLGVPRSTPGMRPQVPKLGFTLQRDLDNPIQEVLLARFCMRCLVLRGPAQSKYTWTFHKSHFVWKFNWKAPEANPATPVFVRACTIEMHMDFSQELFCMGIYRKNGRGHPGGHRFVRACAVEMHMNMCGNLQGCRMCRPRPSFCASLRSRNAHGHVTRAIMYGNLQGIGQTRMIPPRLNTGP